MTRRTHPTTIIPLDRRDVPSVVKLWNASLREFPLTEGLFLDRLRLDAMPSTSSLLACAWLGRDLVGFGYLTPRDRGATGPSPMRLQALVVDPGRRRTGIGTALARWLLNAAAQAGARTAEIGGGHDYLWPGIPAELGGAAEFVTAVGFDIHGTSYDLRSTAASIDLAREAAQSLDGLGVEVQAARPDQLPTIMTFVAREFDPDWAVDLQEDANDGLDPRDVLVASDPSGAIVAFARVHTPGSRPVAPPMFWAGRRGPTAGGLGPIGVASRWRGRGLGTAFLGGALTELARRGATDVVIDFTDRLAFYGRLGFEPWMTFRHATAEVPAMRWGSPR